MLAARPGRMSATPNCACQDVHVESCTTQGALTTIGYVVRNNDHVVHDYYVQGTVGGSAATPGLLKRIYPGETAAGRLDSFGQGDCRITRVDQR